MMYEVPVGVQHAEVLVAQRYVRSSRHQLHLFSLLRERERERVKRRRIRGENRVWGKMGEFWCDRCHSATVLRGRETTTNRRTA
jgi:hypothetical protein